MRKGGKVTQERERVLEGRWKLRSAVAAFEVSTCVGALERALKGTSAESLKQPRIPNPQDQLQVDFWHRSPRFRAALAGFSRPHAGSPLQAQG